MAEPVGETARGERGEPDHDHHARQAAFGQQLERVVLGVSRAHLAVRGLEGRKGVTVGAEPGAECGMGGPEA